MSSKIKRIIHLVIFLLSLNFSHC